MSWTINTLKELLDERQAETQRRLIELNHAHERAVEVQNTYLPRETYEATVASWSEWRTGVDDILARTGGRDAGIRLTAGTFVAALTALGAGISIVIVLANVLTGHN